MSEKTNDYYSKKTQHTDYNLGELFVKNIIAKKHDGDVDSSIPDNIFKFSKYISGLDRDAIESLIEKWDRAIESPKNDQTVGLKIEGPAMK